MTWSERATTRKAILQFLDSADRYWSEDGETGRFNAVYPNNDGKRDIPEYTIRMPEWVLHYYMQTEWTNLWKIWELPCKKQLGSELGSKTQIIFCD